MHIPHTAWEGWELGVRRAQLLIAALMLYARKFFHQSVPRSPLVSRVPWLQLPCPLVLTGKEATCALGERSVSCVESLQEVQEVKEESQAW